MYLIRHAQRSEESCSAFVRSLSFFILGPYYSQSSYRLHYYYYKMPTHKYVVPAAAQLPPLPHTLGVIPGYYANQPTTLVMREKIMSWTGDDYHIKTTEGASVLRVRGTVMSMSGRTQVLDNQGQHLFTVRRELFSLFANYYAENPQGSKFLTVDGHFSCRFIFTISTALS